LTAHRHPGPNPGANDRRRSIHASGAGTRFEWTASILTSSTGAAGGSGSITRITTQCFSLFLGDTDVHLLSKRLRGLGRFFGGTEPDGAPLGPKSAFMLMDIGAGSSLTCSEDASAHCFLFERHVACPPLNGYIPPTRIGLAKYSRTGALRGRHRLPVRRARRGAGYSPSP